MFRVTSEIPDPDRLAAPRTSRAWKRVWKVAFAILAFLLAAAVVEPIRTWAWWRMAHLGSGPTCQDPGWLQKVDLVNAQATSYLPADDGVTYYPGNTADGSLATAWVAKRTREGPALSLAWTLPNAEFVRLLCVTPGYAKSPDRFTNNQRLKTFSLFLNGARQVVPALLLRPALIKQWLQ